MTELVIRIDLKEMMDSYVPDQKPGPTLPHGYRCQSCWRDDGGHEASCEFKNAPTQPDSEGEGA